MSAPKFISYNVWDIRSFFSSKIRASKNEATLHFSEVRGFSEMTKNFGRGNTKYCRTLYPLLCLTKCRDLISERSEVRMQCGSSRRRES